MLDFNFVLRSLPLFAEGLWTTAALAAAGGLGAAIGGGIVVAGTMSRQRVLRAAAQTYIEVMRNTPVLIQMFLIYFGLAMYGIRLPAFASALLALMMQNSAYMGEIYRAGIQSVNRRQYEGALALGLLPWTAMRTMILPQALRRIVPPLASQLVIILKDSSIASTITVAEVTTVGKLILERTAAPYEVFATLAAIYLLLSTVVLAAGRILERLFPVRI